MFSGNIFGGTFDNDIVKPSMKEKKNHLLQKSIEGWRDSDIQKMIQIKIQTTVKMFYSLEICQPPYKLYWSRSMTF